MSNGPVRRAQLIAPFGVGAMTVVPNGTSLVAAGLDHWYEREDTGDDSQTVDLDEFSLEEWRLQAELRVSHLRLPPDWRTRKRYSGEVPNLRLPIPYQRFPMWNFCPRCYLLEPLPLSTRGKAQCTSAEHKGRGSGKGPFVVQVPFVAMCDYGHLQDFPWREWVHRSLDPACTKPMHLRSTGGASLSAQSVDCDCGRSRNLAGITEAEPVGSPQYPKTTLSADLTGGEDQYLCKGAMPWHGEDGGRPCGRPVRGSLRAASNLYYALVKSAIYLPRATATVSEKLIQALDTPPLSTLISQLQDLGALDRVEPTFLRGQQREILQPYTDDQVRDALSIIRQTTAVSQEVVEVSAEDGDEAGLSDETEFRRPEFDTLRHELRIPYLEIRTADLRKYDSRVAPFFSRLMLVDKLRETRALYGFNRIYPESDWRLSDRKALLWKQPPDWRNSWLPAYVVHGEGIFIEVDEAKLAAWEESPDVQARVGRLASNYATVQRARQLRERDLTPRFVLLHTIAHLLMNQLTFECGYSSAALRERIYVSSGPHPMAGILIYTASGDAEGTMGGLVRMGKAGYLEPALLAAIESARWCSADPVCMETGHAGQGPDSCNMAACHNCALVPETACEEFNRFLDRGLVVGTHRHPELGFLHIDQPE
jgi:Domain of unknown function (DUF1998)